MKKSLMLVAYPEISRTIPRYGMQLSARRDQGEHGGVVWLARVSLFDVGRVRGYGGKPAIFEVSSPPLRERPNSPAIVLKQRLHTVIRQSTIGHLAHIRFSFLFAAAAPAGCGALTVNRDLAVIPSVQTVRSAKPNTAVPGP
jgi:hypothetical protein